MDVIGRVTRRDFLGDAVRIGAGVAAGSMWAPRVARAEKDDVFWAYLVHLSFNMWGDREGPDVKDEYAVAKPFLRFDMGLWNDLITKMHDEGVNMAVIDLGDGVKYESHPEIAVKNAWSTAKLKEELARLRALKIEPIPKMNFSTCHDHWLGPYARCVSTEAYYKVCADLIAEAIALFDKPRFLHLGMDEETAENQETYEYVVIRQHDLWWHDMNFLFEQVSKGGARPWIWSDYLWHHPADFWKKMPKSVLQSNWYYGAEFNKDETAVKAYLDLDKNGYDQVPTGSNWTTPENFEKTVDFCVENLSTAHLKGFLQTSWKPTIEACRERHMQAIEKIGSARLRYLRSTQGPQPA